MIRVEKGFSHCPGYNYLQIGLEDMPEKHYIKAMKLFEETNLTYISDDSNLDH